MKDDIELCDKSGNPYRRVSGLTGCEVSVLSELRFYTQKLKSVGSKAFYKTSKDMQVYIPSKKYKTYVNLLQGAGLSKKADYYKTY